MENRIQRLTRLLKETRNVDALVAQFEAEVLPEALQIEVEEHYTRFSYSDARVLVAMYRVVQSDYGAAPFELVYATRAPSSRIQLRIEYICPDSLLKTIEMTSGAEAALKHVLLLWKERAFEVTGGRTEGSVKNVGKGCGLTKIELPKRF